MNRKNKIFYRIPYGTEGWYRFRSIGLIDEDLNLFGCPPFEGGIGASEISTILGIKASEKARPISQDYYHWKVGDIPYVSEPSELMLHGQDSEEMMKNRWCCYDGKDWIERYAEWKKAPAKERSKYILRNSRRINAYVVNKKYPWLFTSTDYYANNNTPSLITGEPQRYGFPTEYKDTSYYRCKQFEYEMPPEFVRQLHHEMLVFDVKYGEIVMFVDKRFRVEPMERNQTICDEILETSYEFWVLVKEGRKYFKLMQEAIIHNKMDEVEDLRNLIDQHEPEPDDSEAYEAFKKERFRGEISETEGTSDDLNLALSANKYLGLENQYSSKKQYYRNLIIRRMTEEKAERMNFGDKGHISYRLEGKKTKPTLRILLK